MDLFFAGNWQGLPDCFIMRGCKNRLLNFENQKPAIGKYMDIYFAGDMYEKVDYTLQCAKINRLMSFNQKSKENWLKHSEELVDIYMAGVRCYRTTKMIYEKHKDFLASFAFSSVNKALKMYKDAKSKSKFFVDSGAYTTWTQGKEVDVDKYIRWLNENDKAITIFGQVDFIPGVPGVMPTHEQREEATHKTFDNYCYMIKKLKSSEKCLWTFHLGEDYIYLKNFLETDFSKYKKGFVPNYIALGGMVGRSEIEKEHFIRKCYEIIDASSKPDIKVHLFGVTQMSILEQFPKVASADSTGWLMVAAMGGIMTENGTILVSDQQKGKKRHSETLMSPELQKHIERFGITLEQLKSDAVYRCIYNACFMEECVKNIVFKPPVKLHKLF